MDALEQLALEKLKSFEEDIRAKERARCVAVARGCVDYLGGYASDPELLSAFHHGIETVARALAAPRDELQVRVLESIGRSEVSDG